MFDEKLLKYVLSLRCDSEHRKLLLGLCVSECFNYMVRLHSNMMLQTEEKKKLQQFCSAVIEKTVHCLVYDCSFYCTSSTHIAIFNKFPIFIIAFFPFIFRAIIFHSFIIPEKLVFAHENAKMRNFSKGIQNKQKSERISRCLANGCSCKRIQRTNAAYFYILEFRCNNTEKLVRIFHQ